MGPAAARRRRWVRWLMVTAGVCLLLVLGLWVFIESAWVEERARREMVARANRAMAGELSIGALRGSLFGHVVLERVALTLEGQPVFAAEQVVVAYSPWVLMRHGIFLDVTVVNTHVQVVEDERGWNVARLTRPRPEPRSDGPSVFIPNLRLVDAIVDVRPLDEAPRRLSELNLDGGLELETGRFELAIDRLTAVDPATDLRVEELEADLIVAEERIRVTDLQLATSRSRVSGDFVLPDGDDAPFEFTVDARPLALADVRPYTDVLPNLPADLRVTLDASGTLEAFKADWQAESASGTAAGSIDGRFSDTGSRLAGDVRATGFDPGRWFPELDDIAPLDVTSTFALTTPTRSLADPAVTFDARSPLVLAAGYRAAGVRARGTFDGGRLQFAGSGTAYGAPVTSTGSFVIESRRLDIDGRFARLDLRRLPASLDIPEIESDLSGLYSLAGTGDDWQIRAQFDASTIAGARIGEGGTARLDLTADTTAYGGALTLSGLDPQQVIAVLPEPDPKLAEITGLVNARIDFSATGTSLETMTADATVHLTESTIAGVHLSELEARASLQEHALDGSVQGRLNGDIGRAARVGEAGQYVAAGQITANVAIPDVTKDLALDDISGRAQVALERASIRGVQLETMNLDAQLDGGRVRLDRLDAAGPNLDLSATGTVALGDSGTSDLEYQVDVIDLALLKAVIEQPLGGSVRLTGRITGPAGRPTTSGKIQATNITSETAEFLSLQGTYTATLPELDLEQLEASLDATATLVEFGDQKADEVRAAVAYRQDRLDVDTTIRQGSRTLEVDSSIVPHPDHREVHIRQAAVAVGDLTWRLQGPEAVIRYGPNRLELAGFRLRSGEAELTLDGTLGDEADTTLTVRASNVNVADLARLALADREFSGRLDLTATVQGSLQEPRAELEGRIVNGSIEGVPFETIVLEGGYAENRLNLDVALEAGPAGHLTASGSLPLVLGGDEDTPRPPFDLTIRSTRINVGLFQPAVPQLDQLRGFGEFDVRVTGEAPEVNGAIMLSDVSFAVLATGVAYQRLQADLSLAGQRLEVRQLRFEDPDGDVATVQGTLDVPGIGPAGEMELRIETDTLDVMNNQFGEVTISAELQAMGDFRTPLMTGTIEVDRGLIEVSQLLRRLQAGYDPVETAEPEEEPEGPFERSSVSITLAMPDNVVIRGRDLRAGSGPVGLGDVNVTVGGALAIAKEIGGEPRIIGRMNVVRGQYRFQGRPFTITRDSAVVFRGDPMNPALDVDAERTISGVVATVHVGGTATQPEISLRSNPPLDQGDILSLVVFNQSMNRLGTEQRVSLAARAGALAAGAIASPLADSVANALNLDVVEIQPVASSEGGASIMLGRQVSERLFVGFRHEFGDEISRLTFEYRLNEFMRLVTSLAQGGSRTLATQQAEEAGIDLIFVVR